MWFANNKGRRSKPVNTYAECPPEDSMLSSSVSDSSAYLDTFGVSTGVTDIISEAYI